MRKIEANTDESQPDIAACAPVLLPLDAERTVNFKTKHGAFIYHFRRITGEDWARYYQGIVNQTIQTKGARDQVYESESALLALVDSTMKSVEGYGDLSGLKNWKSSLPMRHRLAVGVALRGVGPRPNKDEPILCDQVEISLDANWGADGATKFYSGLIHRFRQPGIADLKRFNFESARTRVTGTADAGVTTYPSRQAIAMKIYDDLIESVDGYSVDGKPLTGVEAIKREMDGAHKAAAALALFDSGEEITIE